MTPGKTATGSRDGGLGRGRGGAKDPPKRLGKRSLKGTVCSVAKGAVDLHALRHKASAEYLYQGDEQGEPHKMVIFVRLLRWLSACFRL